jgi:uroporphyrinogen-III synthase
MRILLARPREDAERLAPKLTGRGHEVLIEPLINIVPVPGASVPLDGVQAVLFTSANGARAFATASDRRDLQVLAVGEATAEAARGAGFANVESAGGDARDLARLARDRLDPAKGALLHAAGSAVAGDLAGTLEAAGFTMRRAVLYGAWPVDRISAPAAAVLAARAVDLAILFSPRSAETFVRLVRDAGLADAMARVTLLGLSPAVIEAGAELPWASRIAADNPDEDSLLMAIDRLAQQRAASDPGAASAPAAVPPPPPGEPAPAAMPAPRARRGVAGTLAVLLALVALAWALWIDWRLRTATPPPDPEPRIAALERRVAALPTPEAMIGGTVARVDALERQVQAAGAGQSAAQETAQNAAAAREAATALGARVGALERRATAQPSPEQSARIAALEQRVAQLGATPASDPAMPTDWAARIEALERRVTLAQAAPGPAGTQAAPQAEVAGGDRVAAMERTLGSVEESLARISGALAALERRLAALETASSRGTADQAAIAALRAETERLAGDLSRASAAAQQQQISAPAGAAAQRAAFTQLRDAIARGAPFESELGALRTAGAAAAVTALGPIAGAASRGVPTLPSLTSRFRAVADAIVRADRPADTPWWWLPFERVRTMVSARPVGDVAGDTAGAIAARAEARLASGDLASALRELEGLRGAAAAAAASWRNDAALRAQADTILARVGAELATP